MEWVECVVISIGVHCVSFNNLSQISRCCASRMHMYMFPMPGTPWNRIIIIPYRLLHMLWTYTCDKYLLPGIQLMQHNCPSISSHLILNSMHTYLPTTDHGIWHTYQAVEHSCMYASKRITHKLCHNPLHIIFNHDLYDLSLHDLLSSILSRLTQQVH